MLNEFALMPDVLWQPAESEAELHRSTLEHLSGLLLNDGLVRDLRDGKWREYLATNLGILRLPGKELFESLCKGGRIRPAASTPLPPPEDIDGWLYEATRSSEDSPVGCKLTAALAQHSLAEQEDNPFTVSVLRMQATDWWRARSCSVRLDRKTRDYIRHLGPVFRHSNSLMFIDPNLDPTKPNYAEFGELLKPAVHGGTVSLIEIHRSAKDSDNYPKRNEWIARFQSLAAAFPQGRIKLKVFVWEDFHDRYLISNLIGMSVPHGFDICTDPRRYQLRTTWTRLSRTDADDVQRDFDRSRNPNRLRFEPIEF